MSPAIPEIIMVAEDRTLLEVQQANLCLIEDARIVIGGILREDLDVAIPQAADPEFIKMIVHQLKAAWIPRCRCSRFQ